MAAITVTMNFMVMDLPVGETFSAITINIDSYPYEWVILRLWRQLRQTGRTVPYNTSVYWTKI
jgi:enoyl reductase-like protein